MQVFTGSSRYIVKEIERLVPEAKYSSKKKWFLGIRLIPLTDHDRAGRMEKENQVRCPTDASSHGLCVLTWIVLFDKCISKKRLNEKKNSP